jgi:hypothetical protein
MELLPAANVETAQVATPELRATDVQPVMLAPPAVKLTLPLGTPLMELTFAIKVTGPDVPLGLIEE